MDPSTEITPELLAGFIDEADEYLGTLSDLLMQLEDEASAGPIEFTEGDKQELMNVMFRAAHSLKGLSGAFGFADMNALNHRMETLFDEARMGKRSLDMKAIEVLLNAQATIQDQVEEMRNPTGNEIDVTGPMNDLQAILDGGSTDAAPGDASAETQEASATDGGTAETEAAPSSEGDDALDGNALPASVLDDPELRNVFIETTEEDIEELSQKLLALEEQAEEEILTDAFRVAHTIKGACGAAGLQDAHDLTHRMETVLDQLRHGDLSISDQMMSTLLAVADRLREVVDEVKKDSYAPWSNQQVESLFMKLAEGEEGEPSAEAPASGGSKFELLDPPEDSLPSEQGAFWVQIELDPDNPETDLQSYLIYNKLGEIGQILYCDPDLSSSDIGQGFSAIRAVLSADLVDDEHCEEVKGVLSAFLVLSVHVTGIKPKKEQQAQVDQPANEPAKTAAPAETGAAPKGGAKKAPVVQETIRVDTDRLDQLMNLGGELVINRARFAQIEREFKEVFEGKDFSYVADDLASRLERLVEDYAQDCTAPRERELINIIENISHDFDGLRTAVTRIREKRTNMHNLSEAVNTLSRVSESIQKQIMGTRMVPVGPLFTRFKRVIRDAAKGLSKKINFEISGEQTELDKKMIDELADPLTHMIRNSCDHGIELPDDRVAAGKDESGLLRLEAFHQGNNICIRLTDDGKGIDCEAIREKIVQKEIVTETQAAQLTEKECVQYIFHPGMSTAKKVSDLSGRGMGMDIVISKINNLNGKVDVETEQGQGTTVTIKLPLTLAIITSLLSRIGDERYAIPLEAVSEIVTLDQKSSKSIQGKQVATIRGQVIPIISLEQIMDLHSCSMRTQSAGSQECTLVILGVGNSKIGLIVDELIGQEEIVIKSLSENYSNVTGFAGATIMGDGRVALILDPAFLLDQESRNENSMQERKEVTA